MGNSFFAFKKTDIFFSFIIYHGCEGSSSGSVIENPLGNLQFTYLQDDRVLYFAIEVESSANRSPLESTVLLWYGTDTTASPDNLLLNDEGESGDIIIGDDLYSLKVLNDSLFLSNPISLNDTGKVHMKFQATYGNGSSFMIRDSFFLGNIISLIGFGFNLIAVSWLVLEKTGSEIVLGQIIAASTIPGLIISFFTG